MKSIFSVAKSIVVGPSLSQFRPISAYFRPISGLFPAYFGPILG